MSKPFIKNHMEDLVWDMLPEVLEKFPDACHCDICQYDIAAKALNSLQPKYVAHHKGLVYTRISELAQQFRTDIFTALTGAALLITKNPSH